MCAEKRVMATKLNLALYRARALSSLLIDFYDERLEESKNVLCADRYKYSLYIYVLKHIISKFEVCLILESNQFLQSMATNHQKRYRKE